MQVQRLWIKDFRNIENLDLEFSPHLNIFIGENGSGKTNIMEALCLSLSLKSHRENKNLNFISYGKDRSDIKSRILFSDSTEATSHLCILPNKRSVRFDGQGAMKKNELRLSCPVVFFAPEDLDLIKGGPLIRRNFIDDTISFISPKYRTELKEYYTVLRQKNTLLRTYRDWDKEILRLYNEKLAVNGTNIARYRIKFLQEFDKYFYSLHEVISPSSDISLNYISDVYDSVEKSVSEEIYFTELEKKMPDEINARQSLTGVHKDDIAVILGGRNSRSFASQGQQRSLAICLKLSVIDFYKEKTDRNAIVMLDDVMSELDRNRRSQLLQIIKDNQCFITSTEDNFSSDYHKKYTFSVRSGKAVKL
ncbi:MAG: DNA replication and repair protein RecF [Anaerofustis stercorihominis]|nr:DNA replication and repair protein RecF [Anaerofustis stercorihominis]